MDSKLCVLRDLRGEIFLYDSAAQTHFAFSFCAAARTARTILT